MTNKQGYGYFCLLLATLFWGGNYLFGKILSTDIPPIVLNYARWFPAALILLLLFSKRSCQFTPVIRQHWRILTALSLLGIVIFPVFLYQGLQTTTSLNASIYLAVVPIFVLFLNRLVFGDPIDFTGLTGALFSFVGVLWLLSRGDIQRLTQLEVNQGDLWALGSALSWSIYCCLIRLKPAQLPNTVLLTTLVCMAMLLFTPLFIWQYQQLPPAFFSTLTPTQYSIIAYLIIGPSILSYGFWNYGISLVGADKGAAFTNATPLFAALLGVLVLNETLAFYHMISAGLIIAGLLLCNRKSCSS
ncbi:TPA: DMT family transporter [Pasteurella multocida]|uniref:EamA/RhaT family transporter n=1 Tax=Pasteurella multocida TaxID=747 RepID=A0A849CKN3_PASMD|nr:DMT family transporter [Pasteurella multocida]AFI47136.1 RhaT protein [Pasteurella multocida subsp. multocida str. 3480]AWW53014.1 DMT family transporter [Pasteurella multocida]EPE71260.1 RhaT protein [Pasteurella multocida 671/90]MCH1905232.1 DMT family transporter [Pasteurella multocida]MCL7769467.1 DMT family transporter [Pasteurella multocida]